MKHVQKGDQGTGGHNALTAEPLSWEEVSLTGSNMGLRTRSMAALQRFWDESHFDFP